MPFSNKTIWITGASSGIGEALAYTFARQGGNVVLSARRVDRLESVRQNCVRPRDHMVLPLDVAMPDTHEAAYGKIIERYAKVDILVSNSGIGQRARISETSLDVERRIMDVNYFGTLSITHVVLPDMLRRDSGKIVVINSVLGKISIPFRSSYAASKHALRGYFESLRTELAGTGVDVSVIYPGFIQTDISVHSLVADGSEHGRMDSAQANGMAADVLSEKAARAIRKSRAEALIGGKEMLAIHIQRFFPRLYRLILPRVFPVRQGKSRAN